MNIGHVAHVDGSIANSLDRNIVERGNNFWFRVEPHHVFPVVKAEVSAGQGQVLGRHRIHDFFGRNAMSQKLFWLHIDHNLPRLTAKRLRQAASRHGRNLGTNAGGGIVGNLRFAETV